VVLKAYNAAGEQVRLIYEGAAQFVPGELLLSSGSFIGGASALLISFPGVFSTGSNQLSWAGENDSGQRVDGGVYTIKAEISDQFGQVTALIKAVQVIPGMVQQSLRIYNGAGELVRSILLPSAVPGATRLELPSDSFALEIDPATGKAIQAFELDVVGNAGKVPFDWDGLNDHGAPVASGTYTLQLLSNEGGREAVVTSRSVSVLKGVEAIAALDSARLAPNPVGPGQAAYLFYEPALLGGRRLDLRVYSLAGELVGTGTDAGLTGRIDLGLNGGQAGGIYLVRVQLSMGAAIIRARTLKLAIVR
jgi:flagellar hook assembly protein FlgD